MSLREDVAAGLGFGRVRFLGQRVPVAVRINVNNECHSRCRYCSFWYTETPEMSGSEIRHIVEDLAHLGTKRLSISGGEPTLREDLGLIIDAAVDLGIAAELNSTGYRFRAQRAALRNLALVKLSLDGCEQTHDRLRGRKGAFLELERGIEVLQELGVPFSFAFTMTCENLDQIPFALDFAREHHTFVAFQPVMAHEHASPKARRLYPDPEEYARAIDLLVAEKRRDGSTQRNSLEGLDHIRAWPKIHGLSCWAGDAFVMIEANGDVVPCDRILYGQPIPNCRERGIAWALERLPQRHCAGCGFCGSVEINMLMSGKVSVLPGIKRIVDRNRWKRQRR